MTDTLVPIVDPDTFVPLVEKVDAFIKDDMAKADASRPGVLAESRTLTPPGAWRRAPGEADTGRVADDTA
jgi:hypothetical protein